MSTLNDRIALSFEKYGEVFKEQWLEISPILDSRSLKDDLFKVNRFLRIQLGLLEVDTTLERQYLSNEVDLNEWLIGFEEVILPTIMQHGLPIYWTPKAE